MKKLPKTFRGADVVRGLGMKADKFDVLEEEHAADTWDTNGAPIWLVVPDRMDRHLMADGNKAFRLKDDAVRYARACSCGSVDHRVLEVTAQTLVVATENEL